MAQKKLLTDGKAFKRLRDNYALFYLLKIKTAGYSAVSLGL